MTRVGEYSKRRPLAFGSGVTLGLYPSTQARASVELQRSTSTGAGDFNTIGVFANEAPGGVTSYYDRLPPSTQKWYYRARHVRREYTDSAWTRIVGSTVGELEPYQPKNFRASIQRTSGLASGPGDNTTVSWDSQVFDVGGVFAATSPTQLTVPVTDTYDVSLTLAYTSKRNGSAGAVPLWGVAADLLRNNGGVSRQLFYMTSTILEQGVEVITARLDLNAGDSLKLLLSSPSGGGIAGQIQFTTNCVFSMTRAGGNA